MPQLFLLGGLREGTMVNGQDGSLGSARPSIVGFDSASETAGGVHLPALSARLSLWLSGSACSASPLLPLTSVRPRFHTLPLRLLSYLSVSRRLSHNLNSTHLMRSNIVREHVESKYWGIREGTIDMCLNPQRACLFSVPLPPPTCLPKC